MHKHTTYTFSFLGSSQTSSSHAHYHLAYQLSHQLALQSHTILTGGGLGIMEAANQGAYEAHPDLSQCIHIQHEPLNSYIHPAHCYTAPSLAKKTEDLIQRADHLIIFPGGLGTLHEITTALFYAQITHSSKTTFLIDSSFWNPIYDILRSISAQGYYDARYLHQLKIISNQNWSDLAQIILTESR